MSNLAIKGFVDQITAFSIRGWAKKEFDNTPVNIRVVLNGHIVANGITDRKREDVNKNTGSKGNFGFYIEFEEIRCLLNKLLVFAQNDNGVWLPIPFVPGLAAFEKRDSSTDKQQCAVCHIGMHKTGTTSIQTALSKYLKSKQYIYADVGRTNHSIPIFTMFSENPQNHWWHRTLKHSPDDIYQYNSLVSEKLMKSVSKARFDNLSLIISGEDISFLNKIALLRFRKYLNLLFGSTLIISYVRPPVSWTKSAFMEEIKLSTLNLPLTKIDISKIYRTRYCTTLEKFDDVFGKQNVMLKIFDPSLFIDNDVLLDFCHCIGISRNAIKNKKTIKTNRSISKEMFQLLYIYRKYGPDFGHGEIAYKQNMTLIQRLNKIGKTKLSFSQRLQKQILQNNLADIEWIEKRMNHEFRQKDHDESLDSIDSEDDILNVSVKTMESLLDQIRMQGISLTTTVKQDFSPNEVAKLVHKLRTK